MHGFRMIDLDILGQRLKVLAAAESNLPVGTRPRSPDETCRRRTGVDRKAFGMLSAYSAHNRHANTVDAITKR